MWAKNKNKNNNNNNNNNNGMKISFPGCGVCFKIFCTYIIKSLIYNNFMNIFNS